MKKTPMLKGERIYLKIPTMKDVDSIRKHINDKQVIKFLDVVPHPYKRSDGEWYIKNMVRKGLKEKKAFQFSICLNDTHEIIGGMSVSGIHKRDKNAELGYWIGRKFWRNGYATEALKLILDFSFNKLKLHKVYARANEPNIGSIKLMKKFGFKKEGLFRKHTFCCNRWHNSIQMGVLREEYEAKN